MRATSAAPQRSPPSSDPSGRCAGRRHEVARERDPAGPGHAHGELLRPRVEVPPVRDQAEDDAVVEQELRNGPGPARLRRRHRVPEMRGEAGSGLDRGAHGQRVRVRVPDRGDHASRGDARDRIERPGKLGRDRHDLDEAAREPLLERVPIHRRELGHRDGARRLGVQERALQVEAEAEAVVRLHDPASRQQVARSPPARRRRPARRPAGRRSPGR